MGAIGGGGILVLIGIAWKIHRDCGEKTGGRGEFRVPCVPFLPCVAIFINWYLISQLELAGLALLVVYMGGIVVYYFLSPNRVPQSEEVIGGGRVESDAKELLSSFARSDDDELDVPNADDIEMTTM